MLVRFMVHVHLIMFTFHIVLVAPPPILANSDNIFILFLDNPGFNMVKSPSITIIRVPSFSVVADMGYVTFSSLEFFKDIYNFSILDKRVVSARILSLLGSV